MMVFMRHSIKIGLFLLTLLHLAWPCLSAEVKAVENAVLMLSGNIHDADKEGIAGASVYLVVNSSEGTVRKTLHTDHSGHFAFEIRLSTDAMTSAQVKIKAEKSLYAPSGLIALKPVKAEIQNNGRVFYLARADITLQRAASPARWIAAAILAVVFALIAFDLMHRTLAVLLGATALLGITYLPGAFFPELRIISFEDAVQAVDMNVILLLMSMMIIVGVIRKTGIFQWLASKCYHISGGRGPLLITVLMGATAVASAFLDNVTTMLLIIPVTMQIAAALKIKPIKLLLPEVFASNVGGTATLIGDPPNMMIGSYAGLTFLDFIRHLSVFCLLILVLSMVYFIFRFHFRSALEKQRKGRKPPKALDRTYPIADSRLLILSLSFLGLTIVLFTLHSALNMAPCIAALIGATSLLITSRVDIVELIEKEIDWPTLIFFMMLFIIVAAAEQSGLIQGISAWVRTMSRGSINAAILMVLWFSALSSCLIGNIPATATLLPVVDHLTRTIPGTQDGILWWALALGACLGGNGTLIGAGANVVTAGMAEHHGCEISFMDYFKVCFLPMIITIAASSVWLLFVAD